MRLTYKVISWREEYEMIPGYKELGSKRYVPVLILPMDGDFAPIGDRDDFLDYRKAKRVLNRFKKGKKI